MGHLLLTSKFYTLCIFVLLSTALMPIGEAAQQELNFSQWYAKEREELSQDDLDSILDRGASLAAKTDLVNTLSNGGSAIFPHCSIVSCGDLVSAVVHSCLQACHHTGKNQILLIGVMHSLTETLKQYIVYGRPDTMPGIEELKYLVQESVVVATSDLFHYGTAYSYYGVVTDNPDDKIPISQKSYAFAFETILENLRLLSLGDWPKYIQYCLNTNCDGGGVCQILCYLLGLLDGNICDLRLVDASCFFEDKPPPNWVAATLVELKPISRNNHSNPPFQSCQASLRYAY